MVRLFVECDDALPVLGLLLLLLLTVELKERRVETWEQEREKQRGAAHYQNTDENQMTRKMTKTFRICTTCHRIMDLMSFLVLKVTSAIRSSSCFYCWMNGMRVQVGRCHPPGGLKTETCRKNIKTKTISSRIRRFRRLLFLEDIVENSGIDNYYTDF